MFLQYDVSHLKYINIQSNTVAMSNITKKQATLAVIAVVFATAMIVSVIASSSDSAFAKNSGKKLSFKNQQNQHLTCSTSGGGSSSDGVGRGSGITGNSCTNHSESTNTNSGVVA